MFVSTEVCTIVEQLLQLGMVGVQLLRWTGFVQDSEETVRLVSSSVTDDGRQQPASGPLDQAQHVCKVSLCNLIVSLQVRTQVAHPD